MKESAPEADEGELRTVSEALTTPFPVECLLCYVRRMIEAFGCKATLHWSRNWRDVRAPRATALEYRLGQHGAFCDCEIFLNGWVPASSLRRKDQATRQLRSVQACRGVRRGSSQPCDLWARRPRS